MKAILFAMALFAMCLVLSSSAQNQQNIAPNNKDASNQPHINPLLVGVARATKSVYTHDAVFDFERRRPTTPVKDTTGYEQHQNPPQAR